jgi:hypothetical protein
MTGCTCAGNGLIAALPGWAEPLVEASRKAGEDTVMALRLAEEFGRLLPQPGTGIPRHAGRCWPPPAGRA